MKSEKVVVFGASSGVGEAVATLARREGAHVVAVGRDAGKLEALGQRLGDGVTIAAVDASKRADVDAFFRTLGAFDHLVVALSGGKGAGLFRSLPLDDVRAGFEGKFFPQLHVAQAALSTLNASGSITFISAASARSVGPGTSGLAAINAAIEALVPILALELAPIRVNAVSPGIVDTPWWDAMPSDVKADFFARARATLPVGRVGTAEEVAELVWFLARAGFVTGSVYEIDGGHRLTASRA